MAIDKLGPYQLNSIYCGECSQMMTKLPDECIDLVVTSPPYDNLRMYNGYEFNFEMIAQQLWRVIKVGGVVVWIVGDASIDGSETGTSFRQALRFMEIGFRLHDTMIYKADKPPMNDNRYQSEFEFMFILSKTMPKIFNSIKIQSKLAGRYTSNTINRNKNGEVKKRHHTKPVGNLKIKGNIWHYKIGYMKTSLDKSAYYHPAIFPEALARDHIITWSNPGNVVLDPMIGSGTTAKMAYQLQRHYLGFDISQEYVNLANKRLARTQPPLPIEGI